MPEANLKLCQQSSAGWGKGKEAFLSIGLTTINKRTGEFRGDLNYWPLARLETGFSL